MQFGPVSRLLLIAAASVSGLFFAGCGAGLSNTTATPLAFQGKVFGGQQPIANSLVTVWQAGASGYGSTATELAHVMTDANGNFGFAANAYTCPSPTTQVYITSAGGNAAPGYTNPNILLAAGLGNCSSAKSQFVVVNEVTTAATATALSHFFSPGFTDNSFGTTTASAPSFATSNTSTVPQLVTLTSGQARGNETGVTREAARLNTMANILATCINDSSSFSNCAQLFSLTKISSATPANTLQAAVSMALQPATSVSDLFDMVQGAGAPFVGLATAPTDWTLAIAYTSSDFGFSATPLLPSGSGTSIDITSKGVVFFPSNATGKTGIGSFTPSTATFGNLLAANQLVDPQYVVVVPGDNIIATDIGSGNLTETAPDGGVQQTLALTGVTSSGPISASAGILLNYINTSNVSTMGLLAGFTPSPLGSLDHPATGIALDAGAGAIYAFTSGVNTPCEIESLTAGSSAFAHANLISTSQNCQSGGLIYGSGIGILEGVTTTLNGVCGAIIADPSENLCFPNPALNLPVSLALDGSDSGSGWLTNSGNHSVVFTSAGNGYALVHSDTLPRPYGLALDQSGNVWVSNAGCVSTTTTPCTPGSFTLTELVGVAYPTVTPLAAQTSAPVPSAVPGQSNPRSTATTGFPFRK